MNYVKYSHCTALSLRKVVPSGSTLRPEDYLLVRRKENAESTKADQKESIGRTAKEDHGEVLKD